MAYAMFWWLLVGHAVCDYPLQGDFLARGKNHRNPISGVPWLLCLVAHALIHGGAVALVTGSVFIGCMEVLLHALIDWLKCEGALGFTCDQALHLLSKLAWLACWAANP